MKILTIAFVALIFVMTVPSIQAATIFSDNFNSENGGTGALNYNSFTNWTVSGGTVDLIGTAFFEFFPGNGMYVDLDGTSFQAGLLSSSAISLAAGNYTLQFSLAGSQRGDSNTVLVTLGSVYSESFTLLSGDPLAVITRNFFVGVPEIASLTFQNGGGDNIGAVLDDVSLDYVPTRAPEPASVALLLLSMTGIGFMGRKAIRVRTAQ